MRVARAGGGLRVILHREYRLAVELDTAIGAVEQRDMGLRRAFGQGRLIHRETMFIEVISTLPVVSSLTG